MGKRIPFRWPCRRSGHWFWGRIVLEGFTARTFSERLGDVLSIHRESAESLEAELVSVEESGSGGASDGRPLDRVPRPERRAALTGHPSDGA